MSTKDLFAKLEGTPAQILIVLGLALALFAPVWVRLDNAHVAKAKARLDQAGQIVEIEMDQLRKTQDAERKQMNENPAVTAEERMKKEDDFRKATEAKQTELEKANDTNQLKRGLVNAQAEAAGARWYLLVGWLGRLMLLLGLLALTVTSEGLKQKVILIILLVAMFSSLSGVNLDFASIGHMGEYPADMERVLRGR